MTMEKRKNQASATGEVQEVPLIGRERELNRCLNRLSDVRKGTGSTIFISGQAGIGKTRLIKEVISAARMSDFLVFEGRCTRTTSTNFAPFIEIIAQMAPEHLIPSGMDDVEISDIGSIKETFLDLLFERSKTAPLLIIIEDLQWSDSSSLRVLHQLIRRISHRPILLIGSYREEEVETQVRAGDCPLYEVLKASRDAGIIEIKLDPLDQTSTRILVESTLLGMVEPDFI